MAIVQIRSKDGKISHRVMVRDPVGGFYPTRVFETKIEARQYEAELIKKKAVLERASDAEFTAKTMNEVFEQWNTLFRPKITNSTRRNHEGLWRNEISPVIGGIRLRDIQPKHVAKVFETARERGRADTSQALLFAIMNGMFNSLRETHGVMHNPVLKKFKPKLEQRLRGFLTPAESVKVLRAVETDEYGPAMWIMLFTGLRIGEMCGLQWKDINFNARCITVRHQWLANEREFGPLKNKKQRIVPLGLDLARFLERRRPNPYDGEKYVATGYSGGHMRYETLAEEIRHMCRKAGVRRVTPHELRHSCSELWIEHGASVEDIRRLLDHSNPTTTMKYIHRTEERLSRLADAVTVTALVATPTETDGSAPILTVVK